MTRPYIVCHMVTSIDGKVTGDFLYRTQCENATEVYYEINRNYKPDGFVCGRVTMEGSFTGGWYPELSGYEAVDSRDDFIPDELTGFYAVSFDPKGSLGWKSDRIVDEDPGYSDAQIIEVVTSRVDGRYLGYLRKIGIGYIFAGEDEIDVNKALLKLKDMGINKLLLEGGGIVNGYFERADAIDELSLVVAPVVAEVGDKPLFVNSSIADFELKELKQHDGGVVWMNYVRKR